VFCRALGATSGPPFVCKGIFLRYQILLQMKMVVSDRLYKYVLVYFDECSFVLIDSLPVVKRMSPNPALLFLSSSTNWNDMRTSIFFNRSKFSCEGALHDKSTGFCLRHFCHVSLSYQLG